MRGKGTTVKPFKLRDTPGGNLRDTGGRYSMPGKPNPRPTEVYPGQQALPMPTRPSLGRDVMPPRGPLNTFGPAPSPRKPSKG
jgi:hypothetical protein